jgi:hypothetical protein
MNSYDVKPYRDHREDAAISVYVLNNECSKHLEKISCMYCKRTVWNMSGIIDKIIVTPMPVQDFGIGVNIQCKQCRQQYRLLINAK